MIQFIVPLLKPAAVILVMALLVFLPDLQAGKGLEAALVDAGIAAAKVLAALLGVDLTVTKAKTIATQLRGGDPGKG